MVDLRSLGNFIHFASFDCPVLLPKRSHSKRNFPHTNSSGNAGDGLAGELIE